MSSTVSLSAPTNINPVATTTEYSQKSNLPPNAIAGSYLTQATVLVYDEILRYQRGVKYTHGLTEQLVNDFDYGNFAGNVLWFMDELVGVESDWKKDASPGITGNTAYGYVQFTEDSVETAVNRYKYHIGKFNERINNRDWQPYGIPKGVEIPMPSWIITLDNAIDQGKYNHKVHLDLLSYDQVLALAFVHLHRSTSKDANFVKLALGDIQAAKDLYTNNHHTNAKDNKTQTRIDQFFKIHIVAAPSLVTKVIEHSPVIVAADAILSNIFTQTYKNFITGMKTLFGW